MHTPGSEQSVAWSCLHEVDLLAQWFNDETSARDLLDFIIDNGFRITPASHATQVVRVSAWSARIDIDLVPAVEALWGQGIPTHASCQGGPAELAYVSFPERQSGRASFADLIYAKCGKAVPSLQIDQALGTPTSVLRWNTAETNRVRDAVLAMAWSRSLALPTDRPTVTDLYEWQ